MGVTIFVAVVEDMFVGFVLNHSIMVSMTILGKHEEESPVGWG